MVDFPSRKIFLFPFVALSVAATALTVIPATQASAHTGACVKTVHVHRVKSGETLGTIANHYHDSLIFLAHTNKLKSINMIRIGQKLVVSVKNVCSSTSKSVAVKSTSHVLPLAIRHDPNRLALIPLFDKWAAANDISPSLLKAIAWQESGWRNTAISSVGARGIGQLMPSTSVFVSTQLIGKKLNPKKAEHNIRMTARYVSYLLKLTKGDTKLMLAAYNQGLSSVRHYGMYKSTQLYVHNVVYLQKRFK